MVATVVEDERHLDGSRHLEIVGDSDDVDAALRLVIGRDGNLEEAELSLELHGVYAVIEFAQNANAVVGDVLDMDLHANEGRALIRQRDDGDLELELTVVEVRENEE